MRTLARSVRQFRSILRCQGENNAIGLTRRTYLASQRSNFRYEVIRNMQIHRYLHPLSTISRYLSSEAVQVSTGGHLLLLILNIPYLFWIYFKWSLGNKNFEHTNHVQVCIYWPVIVLQMGLKEAPLWSMKDE